MTSTEFIKLCGQSLPDDIHQEQTSSSSKFELSYKYETHKDHKCWGAFTFDNGSLRSIRRD